MLVQEDTFITNGSTETDVGNVFIPTEDDAVDHGVDAVAEVQEVVGQVEALGCFTPESSSFGHDKSVQESGEWNQTHQCADRRAEKASGYSAVSVDEA